MVGHEFRNGNICDVRKQRYVPTVGPIITAVYENDGPRIVNPGDKLVSTINSLSFDFSDNMNVVSGGANSVINPANWVLMQIWGRCQIIRLQGITSNTTQ